MYRRQGSRPSPWKRNEKCKMAVSGGLKIAVKRREAKRKAKEKRKDIRI